MLTKPFETHIVSKTCEGGSDLTWNFISTGVMYNCEPGSSVSIVSGYGLDDRAIDVRSPAEAKGFFLQPVCPDRLWGPPSLLYNG
jgi:hypothetical protein